MLTLRHSPFDLFERLDQQLHSAERVPSAEIHEHDEAYDVVLELPGVDRDAIDVKATDRTLVISAERRQPSPNPSHGEGAQADGSPRETSEPLMSEFRYGTWSRSFRFPTGIRQDGIGARYRDGLLSVRVPKAQTMTTVNVSVEA